MFFQKHLEYDFTNKCIASGFPVNFGGEKIETLIFSKNISLIKMSHSNIYFLAKVIEGFPGGAVVENLPANAGDTGSSPGLGGSHMPRSN